MECTNHMHIIVWKEKNNKLHIYFLLQSWSHPGKYMYFSFKVSEEMSWSVKENALKPGIGWPSRPIMRPLFPEHLLHLWLCLNPAQLWIVSAKLELLLWLNNSFPIIRIIAQKYYFILVTSYRHQHWYWPLWNGLKSVLADQEKKNISKHT